VICVHANHALLRVRKKRNEKENVWSSGDGKYANKIILGPSVTSF
jgi:hypothetical protein